MSLYDIAKKHANLKVPPYYGNQNYCKLCFVYKILLDKTSSEKNLFFFNDNFAISHSGNNRSVHEDCFIYFLFIETTVRNTTPLWQPPHIYDSLLCEVCSLAKSQKHLLLTQRCILRSIVKEEEKEEETSVLHYGIT